jgi:hypothetical protein
LLNDILLPLLLRIFPQDHLLLPLLLHIFPQDHIMAPTQPLCCTHVVLRPQIIIFANYLVQSIMTLSHFVSSILSSQSYKCNISLPPDSDPVHDRVESFPDQKSSSSFPPGYTHREIVV